MIRSDRGIVLSTLKYSENSRIVRFFCAEGGLMSIMVRNGTKKQGLSKAYLSPFYILDIVYSQNKHSDLASLKEMSGGVTNLSLFESIHKQAQCLFAADLIINLLEPGYVNQELFEYLVAKQNQLCLSDAAHSAWSVELIIGIIQHLGFGIHPSESEAYLFNLQEGTFSSLHSTGNPYTLDSGLSGALNRYIKGLGDSGRNLNKQLLDALITFLLLHVQGFRAPKSLEVLREVYL